MASTVLPAPITERLRALAARGSCAAIAADEADAWAQQLDVTPAQLMLRLVDWAATYARPPVSGFRVGAVAQGRSGALYAGANLEFPGQALAFAVHAEQSATANAWLHGERGLRALAVSAAPCGLCRQFLNELVGADELAILVANAPATTLRRLLPAAFGPRDLGVRGGLLQPDAHGLVLAQPSADPVVAVALAAANAAYAPYGESYAGVALQTADGAVLAGRYAENAAFNPSLSPLQAALAHLTLCGYAYADIARAVLVESAGPVTQATVTRAVLATVSAVPVEFVRAVAPAD